MNRVNKRQQYESADINTNGYISYEYDKPTSLTEWNVYDFIFRSLDKRIRVRNRLQ